MAEHIPQNEQASPEHPLTPQNVPMTMPEVATDPAEGAHQTHYVAIALSILVLALALILGGLYLWGSILAEGTEENIMPMPEPAAMTETPTTTDTVSDELSAIEADLQSELQSLDGELTAIEAEIETASEADTSN